MGWLRERQTANIWNYHAVQSLHSLVQYKHQSLVRGVHIQEAEVSRFKNLQSTNDAALPCPLARFSLWILSLFLHGIYRVVLWTRRKYIIIAIRTNNEISKNFLTATYSILISHFLFSRLDQYYRTARKCKRSWKRDGKRVFSLGSFWSFTLSFSWDTPSCRSYFSHIRDIIKFTLVCITADMCSSFLIRCSRRTLNGCLVKDVNVSDRTKNKTARSLFSFPLILLRHCLWYLFFFSFAPLFVANRYSRRRTAVM